MSGVRRHEEIDAAYAEAIGRATFAFAVLEWHAIWCCDALSEGYRLHLGHRTAGVIGEDLEELSGRLTSGALRDELLGAAREFRRLVRKRNALQHGRPGRLPDGRRALVHGERVWTHEGIAGAAAEFAECGHRLEIILTDRLGGRADRRQVRHSPS